MQGPSGQNSQAPGSRKTISGGPSPNGTPSSARETGLGEDSPPTKNGGEQDLPALPPPENVVPDQTYLVELQSGFQLPVTGAEALKHLTAGAGMGQSDGGGGARWSDVVRALGGVASTLYDDLTQQEQQAIERIIEERRAQRSRIEQLERQQTQLMYAGAALLVVGGVGIYFATSQ